MLRNMILLIALFFLNPSTLNIYHNNIFKIRINIYWLISLLTSNSATHNCDFIVRYLISLCANSIIY